jgi:hypothetical protein
MIPFFKSFSVQRTLECAGLTALSLINQSGIKPPQSKTWYHSGLGSDSLLKPGQTYVFMPV